MGSIRKTKPAKAFYAYRNQGDLALVELQAGQCLSKESYVLYRESILAQDITLPLFFRKWCAKHKPLQCPLCGTYNQTYAASSTAA